MGEGNVYLFLLRSGFRRIPQTVTHAVQPTLYMENTIPERIMKLLLSEAHNWCNASRSKIYDDARHGILSTEKDAGRGNRKVIDVAELERVYGQIRNPDESETDGTGQQISTETLIQSYENRIQDLQKQLALANQREETLTTEKSRLLDVTDRLTLMLPPVDEKKPNWLFRLIGAR